MTGFTVLDWVILVVYFLAMASMGPIFARRGRTTEGYFLGNRSFPGWLIGLAIGYPAGRLFTAQLSRVLFTLPFTLSTRAILGSVLFTLGLAVVSSLGPALGAAHTPASAGLRYE